MSEPAPVSAPMTVSPPDRRRIIVVLITLVVGATLLGLGLTTPADQPSFYLLTGSLAVVWVAGALGSGALHLGSVRRHDARIRPVLAPIVLGLGVGAVFVVGGLIVREIPPLRDYVRNVLGHAGAGSAVLPVVVLITLVNGVAEEVFFRGALFEAVGRRAPALVTTLVYALATATTGNPMLVLAALLLGAVLARQRRVTGGVLAPIITHATWSLVMLLLLPLAIG